MSEQKKHWYCFSYFGKDIESGKHCEASTYSCFAEKGVSLAMINNNKTNARVTDDSVLISVSYLSHMTKADFTAETN